VIVYFGQFWKIAEVAHIIGLLFSHGYVSALILKRMDWAAFWAILSQTHLVTLTSSERPLLLYCHSFAKKFALLRLQAQKVGIFKLENRFQALLPLSLSMVVRSYPTEGVGLTLKVGLQCSAGLEKVSFCVGHFS
jgi:hypothetical protein